jgi:hypothetical protein
MPFVNLSDRDLQLIRDTLQEKADRYLAFVVRRNLSEEEKGRNQLQKKWAIGFKEKVDLLCEKLKGETNHEASLALRPDLINKSDIESLSSSGV